MKLLIAFLVICCVGCARSSRYAFTLKGDIHGIKYGKAFLIDPRDSVGVLYTTEISDGKFEIEGELDEPGQFILKVNRQQFYFFMDGKEMEVTGDYAKLNNRDVKGSPANDLDELYQQIGQERCYNVKSALLGEYRKAIQAGDQELADQKLTEALKTDEILYDLTKEFVKEHPESVYSAYIADIVKGESYENGKALYALLSKENQQSRYGKLLKKHTDELGVSALGVPCPDFEVKDETGKIVSLESQKGNILVLDFWASWCGPCRKEMKNLQDQYAEFKDKGVHFMSVSLDDSGEKWKKACEEEQIPWVSTWEGKGWAKSEIRKLFGIQSIPFIVLLDKDGKIVAKNIRRNSLREKILELL